jgi:putative transposase
MEVMQRLMMVQGTDRYSQIQRQAARTLGISVRTIQRLVKSWQEQGLAGLLKKQR